MKFQSLIPFCVFVFVSFSNFAQQPLYTNSIGMEFVLVNPGNFILGKFQPPFPKPADGSKLSEGPDMGYTPAQYKLAEQLARRDALPGFNVTIKKSFYIGKYEVTQAQWKKVMGSNPSVFKSNTLKDDKDLHPVENISWDAAQLFLKKLNSIDKANVYRLPTEFEWEYAARAGAEDDIPWSEIRLSAQLGTPTTNSVGQKKPNAWGLFDMLGNVWEWVQDYYNEKIFADPTAPRSGRQHVLKGASFVGDVKNATYMTHAAGPGNGWDVGFRVVMEVK